MSRIEFKELHSCYENLEASAKVVDQDLVMSMMMRGNGAMMLTMGSMTILTTAYSVTSYFKTRKENKIKAKKAEAQYKDYLLGFTSRLDKLQEEQKQVLEYNFPKMETLARMVENYDARIYERLAKNDDFLDVSLGQGEIDASYKIDFDNNEAKEKSDLEKFVHYNVVLPYSTLKDAPITISLRQATVGLVGNEKARNEALQTMLFQVATMQAYRDVQFITITSDEDYDHLWKEWRWLPHFQIQSLNLRGLVHNAQTRDMVLNSFYQLLVKRRQEIRENSSKDISWDSHFILVITDESLLNGSNLNEFLAEDMSRYGVTVIWSKDTQSMLPETVNTLVDYNNRQAAKLISDLNEYRNQEFVPNHYPKAVNLEDAIKRLANLELVEAEKNSIPDSISFLSMYGIKDSKDLQIAKRWSSADTSKTLAVPLGLRGKNDIVYLNLHERAHGPHGLLAGTTGSGKSEVLQSYILSLSINFAPEDVGFLPIDFKGGGMANLFKNLPHLLGSITNLDGAGTVRALKSIHAELQRRQQYFKEYNVNHINGYTKLYKKGKTITDAEEKKKYPTEPLPHLFLISDEFAELKANEPEFMDELISTARIGRSLGVHLILATQKPSGVVNDQIWSNSRFKIALKVAEEADSKEVIHTPDAASITQPGRAYLQVGNNEIYELFQTAYSGADYDPNGEDESQKIDDRLWLINHLGQAELLTTDLSDQDQADNTETESELEAVINEIAEDSKELHSVLPMKPWLPPLKEIIHTPEINWKKSWQSERVLKAPFGMLDIPSKQEQKALEFDLPKMAPALFVGSSGYGKSTALQTLIVNLAKLNNPEQMHFYLLDFGTNGLLPLTSLPHVADIVSFDNLEKMHKMLKRLKELVQERKDLFQSLSVANLAQYEEMSGKHLPAIVVALDGYDAVAENNDEREKIDAILSLLFREGPSLGIFTILTSTRDSNLRLGLQSNINKKIALYLVDEDVVKGIFGRDALPQSPIPGRAQMELEDEVLAAQIAFPTEDDDSLKNVKLIKDLGSAMKENCNGSYPDPLPMLDATLSKDKFKNNKKVIELWKAGKIALGLDRATTNPVSIDFEKNGHFLALNSNIDQSIRLENTLAFNMQNLVPTIKKVLVKNGNLNAPIDNIFDVIEEDVNQAFNNLRKEIELRKITHEGVPIYVFIPNIHTLNGKLSETEDSFSSLLNDAKANNIFLMLEGSQSQLLSQYTGISKIMKSSFTAGTLGTVFTKQNEFQINNKFGESPLKDNEINVFKGYQGYRVQLMEEE